MKVAITGGSGFVGSHLIDALQAADHEVCVLDMLRPPYHRDVEYHEVHVSQSTLLGMHFDGCDALVHLAAISNTKSALLSPWLAWEVNVLGANTVLREAYRVGLDHVILASSSLVSQAQVMLRENDDLRRGTDWIVESDPVVLIDAAHPYLATKIASETVAAHWRNKGLPVQVFRYGIMYGPRMTPGVVAHEFIKRGMEGKNLVVQGDGKQWRQYMHVEDLVTAHVMALERGYGAMEADVMNIVGSDQVTIQAMAERVADELDVGVEYTAARPDDIQPQMCAPFLAERVMGWAAWIPLAEGLKSTIDWYQTHGC